MPQLTINQVKLLIAKEVEKQAPDWDKIKRLCDSAKVAKNILNYRNDEWVNTISDNPPIKIL